jgi:hypothetical protein
MRWPAVAVLAVALHAPAYAADTSCWGGSADLSPDLTCVRLTEELLLSLRRAPEADVQQAMKTAGRVGLSGKLHYISNFEQSRTFGAGNVTYSFGSDGTVATIDATVEDPERNREIRFLWTRDNGDETCSDFDDSLQDCNGS